MITVFTVIWCYCDYSYLSKFNDTDFIVIFLTITPATHR